MPNPYYNETFNAALGSQARSAALEQQFRLIELGFDLIRAQIAQAFPVARFINLLDCPQTYAGSAQKLVRVNAGEAGLEFVSAGRVVIKFVGGTSYTLVPADAGALVVTTNNSPVTITVPPATFTQGDIVCFNQYGQGQVTFVAGTGTPNNMNLNSSDNLLKTRKQHAQVALMFLDINNGTLIGERNAPSLDYAVLVGGNEFTNTQNVKFQQMPASSGTLNTDASLSNHFYATLTGNSTLAFPTNLRDGVILNWQFRQDATGGRTMTFNSQYRFFGGAAPVLSTAANAIDSMTCQYNAAFGAMVCSFSKGA